MQPPRLSEDRLERAFCPEPPAGVAPTATCLPCTYPAPGISAANLERVDGVEPTSSGWKPEALPLSYTRRAGRGGQGGPSATLRCCVYLSRVLLCRAPPRPSRLQGRKSMVPCVGIEPTSPGLQPGAFTRAASRAHTWRESNSRGRLERPAAAPAATTCSGRPTRNRIELHGVQLCWTECREIDEHGAKRRAQSTLATGVGIRLVTMTSDLDCGTNENRTRLGVR